MSQIITVIRGEKGDPGGQGYQKTFVNAELVNSKLIVNHELNVAIVAVTLINDVGDQIHPANIRILNNNAVELDLENLTPIANTWKVKVA